MNSLGFGFGTTFDLFGRTALALAALPIAWADASGRVGGNVAQVSREGLADPRLKLSVNLVGGQALAAGEFAEAQRKIEGLAAARNGTCTGPAKDSRRCNTPSAPA